VCSAEKYFHVIFLSLLLDFPFSTGGESGGARRRGARKAIVKEFTNRLHRPVSVLLTIACNISINFYLL
jgi:hypothetical protein